MTALAILVAAVLLGQAKPRAEDILQAIECTGAAGYTYEVKGRHERSGEFLPEGILTSRIRQYRSARKGEMILIKGPDGLWKTPGEHVGEEVENPDPEAAGIVAALVEAEVPHLRIARMIRAAGAPQALEDRTVNGTPCRRYLLTYPSETLRESIEPWMEKSIARGATKRPDEVRWSSAKGTLQVSISRETDCLVNVVERKSVRISYRRDEAMEPTTYKLEIAFAFSDWERTETTLPPEVRNRLGVGQAHPRSAILVSVDGLRPDAIEQAPAVRIQWLRERGACAVQAETIRPSITLPSHVAMVTGLDDDRHGVTWNDNREFELRHPTVFSVSSAAGKPAAIFIGKEKLRALAAPGTATFASGPASAEELADAFAKHWPSGDYAFAFVHFAEPDAAGHHEEWMSEPYLEAVRKCDDALGKIIDTVQASGRWETTVILVTADHGGSDHDHYVPDRPDKPENVRIPWICVGPGIPAGLKIDRPIRTVDTGPTILMLLGLPVPENLDGKLVEEVLRR